MNTIVFTFYKISGVASKTKCGDRTIWIIKGGSRKMGYYAVLSSFSKETNTAWIENENLQGRAHRYC